MGQTFADRLKIVMDARGWSPGDWAREAGFPSASHVANHIDRKVKNPRPSYETVAALAKAARVPIEWLGSGEGASGLDGGGYDADVALNIEREHQPKYAESEAPCLLNLPDWADLVAAAIKLEEARGVPAWAFEYLGLTNGLLLAPLVPLSVVEMAKVVPRFVTQAQAEAKLARFRAANQTSDARAARQASSG